MDKLSLIKAPVIDELKRFNALFEESLTTENPFLQEVLSYIRQKKGKMMRPALVLLLARLLGDINDKTLHSAVSLELLHTASLVHDDVVDESEERRGRPSVNAVFRNKVAVLSGDYVLAAALLQASKTTSLEIISMISRLGQDLSEGELLQLSNVADQELSEAVYFSIIRKKTAALFASSAVVAAYSVGASSVEVDWAYLLGEYIGICFQIKDDIFDYFDEKGIGKPTGNDMREGKLTLPAIYAIRNSGEKEAVMSLVQEIKTGNASRNVIEEMIAFSVENGGIEYAVAQMMEYHGKAVRLLDRYPDSDIKRALLAFVDYVVERKK